MLYFWYVCIYMYVLVCICFPAGFHKRPEGHLYRGDYLPNHTVRPPSMEPINDLWIVVTLGLVSNPSSLNIQGPFMTYD